MKIKILQCECKSKYQDEKYGKGNRIHNAGKPSGGSTPYICTVCDKRR